MPSNNNSEPVIFNDHHADKIKRVNRKDEQSEKILQWLVTLGFLGWAIAMTVLYIHETKVNDDSKRTNGDSTSSSSSTDNALADPVIVRAALKGMFLFV